MTTKISNCPACGQAQDTPSCTTREHWLPSDTSGTWQDKPAKHWHIPGHCELCRQVEWLIAKNKELSAEIVNYSAQIGDLMASRDMLIEQLNQVDGVPCAGCGVRNYETDDPTWNCPDFPKCGQEIP